MRAGRSRSLPGWRLTGVTHVDAPWHYNSTIQGRKAATIDELPLEWFFADGVVLDMTHKGDGEKVGVAEVAGALATLGYTLSRWTSCWSGRAAMRFTASGTTSCGAVRVSAEATRWLFEQGVRVMGIDAWGWDGPPGPSGRRGTRASGARGLLGGPPVRLALLPDRAIGEPGILASVWLQGRLLPAQNRRWEPPGRLGVVAILPG